MSTVAATPLNDFSLPSGGVILKSSDGTEFKVYKNILALASPFFRQMFTLPQSVDSGDSETQTTDANKNNSEQIFSVSESSSPLDMLLRLVHPIAPPVLPGRSELKTRTTDTSENRVVQIIPMSESSNSLDILLRLIYPIDPPSLPGMSEAGQVVDAWEFVNGLEPVLAAALKYDMSRIVKDLTSKLLDAAETTLPDGSVVDDTLALRVFVLACRHKLKEEARRAAHASLKGRTSGTFIEELRHISAAQYFYLIQFHNKIVDAIRPLLEKDKLPFPCKEKCSSCGRPCNAVLWNQFVAHALPILLVSPRSSRVFSTAFFEGAFQSNVYITEIYGSRFTVCRSVPENWDTAYRGLRESIDKAAAEIVIDLSEI